MPIISNNLTDIFYNTRAKSNSIRTESTFPDTLNFGTKFKVNFADILLNDFRYSLDFCIFFCSIRRGFRRFYIFFSLFSKFLTFFVSRVIDDRPLHTFLHTTYTRNKYITAIPIKRTIGGYTECQNA